MKVIYAMQMMCGNCLVHTVEARSPNSICVVRLTVALDPPHKPGTVSLPGSQIGFVKRGQVD